MPILEAITKYGRVIGAPGRDVNIGVFKGIPYAAPPIGELRFAPPQDPHPWTEAMKCWKFSPICVQQIRYQGRVMDPDNQSEDCLYLNIWTPAKRKNEKLPVMFWIHGGANNHGSGGDSKGSGTGGYGEGLAREGVVVVTINYRLNLFGYLCMDEIAQRSGLGKCVNNGLLDQQKALRWVHENIEEFGGDPDNITVFGQSAGGNNTRSQMVSPLTKGLFKRAIPQSGGGVGCGRITNTLQQAKEIAEATFKKTGLTVDELLNGDAAELYKRMSAAALELFGGDGTVFQPFVDDYTLTDDIGKSLAEGKYDVDVMCGNVEGDWYQPLRNVKDAPDDIKDAHRALGACATLVWARIAAKNNRKIYHYFMDRLQPERAGTPHGSDVSYVFGNLSSKQVQWTSYDCEMSIIMMKYWTNFAKTGNPNGEGLPDWPVYTQENPVSMTFSDDTIAARDMLLTDYERRVIDFMERTGCVPLTSMKGI